MKSQVTSIEQSRRLLEQTDIAGYLPHYPNVMYTEDGTVWTIDVLSTEVEYPPRILPAYHFNAVKLSFAPCPTSPKRLHTEARRSCRW